MERKATKAPAQVRKLVRRFQDNRDQYTASGYNETQLRREFVDPLFNALDWDVANKAGYAEAYKDVVHEDAIKIGGATKAPDYCFRVGGTRKFFVETKRPEPSETHSVPLGLVPAVPFPQAQGALGSAGGAASSGCMVD